MVEAMANLATATASDRVSVAALTATNSTLTTNCTTTHTQILSEIQDLTKIKVTAANLRKQLGAAGIKFSGSYHNHYCWTCGNRCNHNIRKRPTPATVHQKKATSREKNVVHTRTSNLLPDISR